MSSLFDKIGAELRRGLVQIVALSLLRERLYGYQIVKILAAAGLLAVLVVGTYNQLVRLRNGSANAFGGH